MGRPVAIILLVGSVLMIFGPALNLLQGVRLGTSGVAVFAFGTALALVSIVALLRHPARAHKSTL
jgi:hypothetical protein